MVLSRSRMCSWKVLLSVVAIYLIAGTGVRGDDLEEIRRIKSLQEEFRQLYAAGKYAEAGVVVERILPLIEKQLADFPEAVATWVNNSAVIHFHLGEYQVAEPRFKRALQLRQKALGTEHELVASDLSNLAVLYDAQARYSESEPLYRQALAIRTKKLGEDHEDVALSLNNLASWYDSQGRAREAAPMYRKALVIWEKALGKDDPQVAVALTNLAVLYSNQARYAEAEGLYQRALSISEKKQGAAHPDVAIRLSNLALHYERQGRREEAEAAYRRALQTFESAYGHEHPQIGVCCSNLGSMYLHQGRFDKAEPMLRRALAIGEKSLGADHPDVAISLTNLGRWYRDQQRYDEAEAQYRRALKNWEGGYGADHPRVAGFLNQLAIVAIDRGEPEQAKSLLDRALSIADKSPGDPRDQFRSFDLRAHSLWKQGKAEPAIADMQRALELAESERFSGSGGAFERAQLFAEFGNVYEQLLAWHVERGAVAEAFAVAERSRSRAFIDQLQLSGVDLLAGLSDEAASEFRRRESENRTLIASLQGRLRLFDASKTTTADERSQVQSQLDQAREAALQIYRDMHTASPAGRLAFAEKFEPIAMTVLQQWAADREAVILRYVIGSDHAFLFVIPGSGALQVLPLAVTEEQAEELQATAGPLTIAKASEALQIDGLPLWKLFAGKRNGNAVRRLSTLYRILLPPDVRDVVTGPDVKRLVIVPDGPLSLLPFEMLVVREGDDPTWLLDVGPPIQYSPSATVLHNLSSRKLTNPGRREPVLTVADPQYQQATPNQVVAANVEAELSARSRFRGVGGTLARLPYSATESGWITQVFTKQGLGVSKLLQSEATEAAVRSNVADRRIIHLACHGLTDGRYGNHFGSLALTPGKAKSNDAADDGFLTLAEIYDLRLHACELAILSACETNYGPQQQGEGVWALSRGFLVAGAKRVVASNWLVDDEAAASLVSYFCGGVALAEKNNRQPDYAKSLHDARKWVRSQEKWKSPYYWGTFVLVGAD